MIKINLSNAKKQLDVSNLAGFDFTKLKIRAVILFIFLIYVPDFFLVPMWEEERNKANEEVNQKSTKLNGLRRKIAQSLDLEKQIRELKAQEQNLGKKLLAVKQAISEKRNPSSLLLYIAKNTPNELWIRDLTILQDEMVIRGEALDYTSIGNFVNSLRSSVFIREANIASTASQIREADKKRIETFEVKFKIARFDQ
jgi:Tfp pilus assembly protein PilN